MIALLNLPIEKFPDIAPPSVYVWASYPGASADTVQKTVIAPLEQAINGVDHMTYMTSTADNGSASIAICAPQMDCFHPHCVGWFLRLYDNAFRANWLHSQ